MEGHKQSSGEKIEKFTWKVENFSYLDTEWDYYSEPFVLGGYPWQILLCKRGDNSGDLSIFLSAGETANTSKGWSRHVKFRFLVLNQIDNNRTIVSEEIEQEFNAREIEIGVESLVSSTLLHDPHSRFLVNDVCIVGVEVSICNSKHKKQVSQTSGLNTSFTSGGGSENLSELMDFNGLGQIENAFIPLLEKVCSQHPSLIARQHKRSPKCMEWAFTALGRVLYFLKTKKVKDMTDLACKELQILWEELELFCFDLTWLEPHVQSALGVKGYLERLEEAQKLKDNVVALELEMETLKSKMATVEENLDDARELLEAQDLEEIDMEAELGFEKL